MGRNVRIIQADKYFVVCKQAGILKNEAQVAKEIFFAANFRPRFFTATPPCQATTNQNTAWHFLMKISTKTQKLGERLKFLKFLKCGQNFSNPRALTVTRSVDPYTFLPLNQHKRYPMQGKPL